MLGPATAAVAATDPHKLWSPPGTPLPKTASVKVKAAGSGGVVKPHYPVPASAKPAARQPIKAASASVDLVDSSTSAPVRAGDLPVSISQDSVPIPLKPAAGTVSVSQVDSKTAAAAGVDGLAVKIEAVKGSTPGHLQVGLDVAALDAASGGQFSKRGRLIQLPACALTTPDVAACRTSTPIVTRYDAAAKQVVADVALPAGKSISARSMPMFAAPSAQAAAGPMLLAQSTTSGGTGDYKASSLTPSASWAAGGSSGALTYSYPVQSPPALGGAAPAVSLGYNSSSVDGKTSATNSQASWIGDGWDYNPGFIERTYKSCDKDGLTGSADLCWAGANSTVSFGSHSGPLVHDDTTGVWRLKDDDGTKVEFKTGASNGTNNGEYVKLTDTSGTAYYFGANYLPTADGTGVTTTGTASNSVSTVPVYSPNSTDPCYTSGQGNGSWCRMAQRWALDYVVDPHGNLITYTYTPEINYYARGGGQNNGNGALTDYTRANLPHQIAYGQRLPDQLAAGGTLQPAARITFTTTERCLPNSNFSCDASLRTTANASNWKDVPVDQECKNSGACNIYGPTFFTTKRLTGIATQVRSNNAWQDVDSYALTQNFQDPQDGSNQQILWLDNVQRTGKAGTSQVPVPPVSFIPTMMPNRVDGIASAANGATFPDINRPRIQQIHTETGAILNVDYNLPGCSRIKGVMPTAEDNNAMACFPVKWTPPGDIVGSGPILDWFNHYTVASLSTNDPVTGAIEMQTAYKYDRPAWHRDDSEYTDPASRTWGDFRGFATVTTINGGSDTPQTQSRTTYLQGMNGDLTTGAPRSVSVTDALGESVTDDDWLAGQTLQTESFNNVGDTTAAAVTVTRVTDPHTTATHATNGSTTLDVPLVARYAGSTAVSTTQALKADGTKRTTATTTTTDPANNNRVKKVLNTADGLPDICTRTSYAAGADPQRTDLVSETLAVSGSNACGAPAVAANTVSDTRVLYDGRAFGQAGATGDGTGSQTLSRYDASGNPVYLTTAQSTFDPYGRTLSVTDLTASDTQHAVGQTTTTTTYTPAATGELPASTKVSTPVPGASGTWDTVTTLDVRRSVPLTVTDPNGKTTTHAYDALGRPTSVWWPGRTTTQNPNQTFTYTLDPNRTAPPTVTSNSLVNDSPTYATSVQILDGLGRTRQVQTHPSTTGYTGRLISDTFYDSHGRAYKTNAPWYNADAAPGGTLVVPDATSAAADNQIPNQTRLAFDGMGRQISSTFVSMGVDQWSTTTAYPGIDRTDVTPPSGAWPTSTVTDARGRTTQLWQYKTATPSGNAADATVTSYAYTPDGKPSSRTDAAGNTWSYTYDQRGRQIQATDPDTGTTTSTYDDAGNLTATTDARGGVLVYTYDLIGRKTGSYQGSIAPGNQLAAWTYDTVAKGKPAASTRYVGGATGSAYATAINSYDDAYRATGTTVTIPGSEVGQTAPFKYTATNIYDRFIGSLNGTTLPGNGGLPAETLVYTHETYGTLSSYKGAVTYDLDTMYDALGQPTRTTVNPYGTQVVATTNYDQATGQVLSEYIDKQTSNTGQSQITNYTYNPAGQITSITGVPDNIPSATDRQCFTYDNLGRLTTAWSDTGGITTPDPSQHKVLSQGACTNTSPTSGAVAPAKTTVGGSAPYWQDYTYDLTGNRTQLIQHDPAGNTANDTITTQTFPAAGSVNNGSGTGGPHALTGTNTKVNGSTTVSGNSTYDATGNTTSSYTTKSGTTTLTWNGEDKLDTYTPAVAVTGIDGKCMDDKSSSSANGNPIQIWTCNNSGAQKYSTTGQRLMVFNKCVTAMGTAAGSAIQLQPCDSTNGGQTWTPRTDGTLYNPASARCLAVPASGTALALADCTTPAPAGQVWSVPNNTTSYLYDADGNQLIRRDPGKTTINVGQDELSWDGKALTGTRYYPMPNGMTTVRVGTSNPVIQIADNHGTASLAVDLTTLAETRRPTDPFGNPRGTQPTGWASDHGYVGGTKDDATGLTNLGAREYQPTTGRFLSPDPILVGSSPQQWNGYAYSNNNPVNLSDPSGLMVYDPTTGYAAGTGAQLEEENLHAELTVKKKVLRDAWTDYTTKKNVCSATVHARTCITHQQADREHATNEAVGKAVLNMLQDATLIIPDIKCSLGGGDTGKNQRDCYAVGLFWSLPEVGPLSHDIEGLEGDLAEIAARSCVRPHSFVTGTAVLMADGHTKPIEDVQVGDEVENALPGDSASQKHRVTAIHRTTTDTDFTRLTIKTATGAQSIESTSNHPYYNETSQAWTEAGSIKPGDHLQTLNGAHVIVTATESYVKPQITYDLTIADLHTYYVLAGDTPVLVHNCDEWTSVGNLDKHFAKHGPEMGLDSQIEYREAAKALMCDCDGGLPGVMRKVDRTEGAVRYFDPETDEYGMKNSKGIITFYKLDGGINTFKSMPGEPWKIGDPLP